MGKAVGIDLGTTNSVVAAIEATQTTVIPNAEGFRTTASIVAYTKDNRTLVGQIARRQNLLNPENTFYSVKRFIGSRINEIDPDLLNMPYKIISDNDGNILLKCPVLNQNIRPEEISAQVLKKIKKDSTDYLGQNVNKAVITVPAYFNDAQRQATKYAGKIAGLKVLRIINEPTAASLAYGLEKNNNEIILVFDLGGGTFDVSILEVGDGVFEVLATAGDTRLGGDNFNQIIMEYLLDEYKKTSGIDLREGDHVIGLQRISEAVERTKAGLTLEESVQINLPFITGTATGAKHFDITLTRDKFDELCQDEINKCSLPLERALIDAGITADQVKQVVLVGGSTRIPAVKKLVSKLLNARQNASVNPDEVVAIGAAIQAAILVKEVRNILLLDVTPLSLGIETLGGVFQRMIQRNTALPARTTEVFSTASDNQRNVEIRVYQGEREIAEYNKSLGIFTLGGIRPAPRAVPKIDVTFDIDVNGILSVIARDRATAQEKSITISGSSNLTQLEIDEIIETAEKNAAEEKKQCKQIRLKTLADEKCNKAERAISTSSRYLSSYAKRLKTNIKNQITKIRREIKKRDNKNLELELADLNLNLREWEKYNSKGHNHY